MYVCMSDMISEDEAKSQLNIKTQIIGLMFCINLCFDPN